MEYKITKSNLNKAKEKIVMDYLDQMRAEAKRNTEEILKQMTEKNFGRIPSEEEINAKRNRR